ncbi:Hypothetical protein PACV_335 [Pacmanvirus A23]|uniref:Hypothetical protein n=1 Tax=Pacmanvirus A23 TaxID=1932881 RepID=UPI000A09490A|nr:Hypothetical protein B9W72_gp331 [Pacmanvirus A23]SIP86048.1 Hypothetical protein PACV_335 [Pacmanvirus A23]
MSQTKTFKLIVQVSDNCLDLLRYLDKNINDINKLGVRVQVEKIAKDEFDDEMVENLRKRGITRLPALIAPDNKIFIGLASITNLFEKNLNNVRTGQRVGPIRGGDSSESDSNLDISDYMMKEMYEGTDRSTGKIIVKDDKDELDDEASDIERKMGQYRRNIPKHRQQSSGRERDIDPVPRNRNRRRDELEDNIEVDDYDEPEPPRRGRASAIEPSDDMAGDDMDQRMLSAWMDNNHTE